MIVFLGNPLEPDAPVLNIPVGSSPSQRPGAWKRWATHVPTGTEEAQKCMEWQSNSYTLNYAFPCFFPEHSFSLPSHHPPIPFLPALAGFLVLRPCPQSLDSTSPPPSTPAQPSLALLEHFPWPSSTCRIAFQFLSFPMSPL